MQCPFCQHPNNRVLESRSAELDRSIRRRRECLACDRRFTTYERIEYVPITVIKRGGDRESFDRSKILRGIVTACEKTGVSAHAIELMVDEIEADLQQQAVREVSSENIGERVLARLQQVSEVAYVRFASVYRQFQGIRDFTEALSQLKGESGAAKKHTYAQNAASPVRPPTGSEPDSSGDRTRDDRTRDDRTTEEPDTRRNDEERLVSPIKA